MATLTNGRRPLAGAHVTAHARHPLGRAAGRAS